MSENVRECERIQVLVLLCFIFHQKMLENVRGSEPKVQVVWTCQNLVEANAAREYLDKHNLVEFTQLLVQSVTGLRKPLLRSVSLESAYWAFPLRRSYTLFNTEKSLNMRSSRNNLSVLMSSWPDSRGTKQPGLVRG